MMTEESRDILDDCLDRMFSGQESIEACLEPYPEHREELEPLLSLAKKSSDALAVEISPEAKAAGKAAVLARTGRPRSEQSALFPLRRLLLRPVFAGTVLVLLLFGGTAMAAAGAQPDSQLYPVKLFLEDIRTAIAIQDLDQARVEVGHADARLDELESMLGKGKPEYVPALLVDFDGDIGSAIRDVDDAETGGKDTAGVRTRIADVQSRHDRIVLAIEDDIPEDIRTEIEDDIAAATGREAENMERGDDPDQDTSAAGAGDDRGGDDAYGGSPDDDEWESDSGNEYHETHSQTPDDGDGGHYDPPASGGDDGYNGGEGTDSSSGGDGSLQQEGAAQEGIAPGTSKPHPDSADHSSME